MKTLLAALIPALAATGALAQAPAPKATAPKPVPTLSVKPDGSMAPRAAAPAAAPNPAAAAATAERLALQADLAWVGVYNGLINGEPNERVTAAVKVFQRDNGGAQTGTLTPQQRQILASAAKALQDNAGWKVGIDPVTGAKLGLPTKFAPVQSASGSGSKWSSAQGQIQIETWRRSEAGLTLAQVAEREKKEPAGRKIEFSVSKPDFFVLGGLQGLKRFYVRAQIKGNEVRGFTVLYDQATEGTMGPVVVAMSSAFAPFDASGAPLAPPAPPPRRKVEYASGVAVAPDVIATDAYAIEGCEIIVAAGLGHAERLRTEKDKEKGAKPSDLALLKLYGAPPLAAAPLARAAAPGPATITGIADPQMQAGGSAITATPAQLTGSGAQARLDPAPGLGFDGAAVSDPDGRLLGLVRLRSETVAGPAPATPTAGLLDAETVRARLAEAQITPAAADKGDPKAATVRLICIRK
jgi:peptidoglycan hydrolase-like protein with peptidoglycan-binding domain